MAVPIAAGCPLTVDRTADLITPSRTAPQTDCYLAQSMVTRAVHRRNGTIRWRADSIFGSAAATWNTQDRH